MPAATVVILLGHLFVFAYLHAKCASDPPEKHLTGAPIPFPGLPGYEYFGFSSLRAELLKNASTSTVAIKKKQLFQSQASSNCLHHLLSLGLGHLQQQEINPNHSIRQ